MIWVLVVVVVVLLAIIGVLVARQQRSRKLREDFGPEYRRVVTEQGDQRSAEQELAGRRQRVNKFEIRPLDPEGRERYLERWRAVQRSFVDDPSGSVREAHALVQQVMHERGYPVDDDFEQRAADISVNHPVVVENYRSANAISVRAANGQASTEQLRESMVNFRALFDDLLVADDTASAHDDEVSDQSELSRQPTRR